MCGGEAANASTDNYQVVGFTRINRRAGLRPEIAIAQAVGGFEGAHVAAAQSGERRRVVSERILVFNEWK